MPGAPSSFISRLGWPGASQHVAAWLHIPGQARGRLRWLAWLKLHRRPNPYQLYLAECIRPGPVTHCGSATPCCRWRIGLPAGLSKPEPYQPAFTLARTRGERSDAAIQEPPAPPLDSRAATAARYDGNTTRSSSTPFGARYRPLPGRSHRRPAGPRRPSTGPSSGVCGRVAGPPLPGR